MPRNPSGFPGPQCQANKDARYKQANLCILDGVCAAIHKEAILVYFPITGLFKLGSTRPITDLLNVVSTSPITDSFYVVSTRPISDLFIVVRTRPTTDFFKCGTYTSNHRFL